MHKGPVTLSLAVITKNRSGDLHGCVSSIARQTDIPNEILIIDSSTNDRTRVLCEHYRRHSKLPVRYFFEPKPGYATSRNRAIKESRSCWLGFVDDDCVLDTEWVKTMRTTLKRYSHVAAIEGESRTYFPQNIYALALQFYEVLWKKNAIVDHQIIDMEILDTKNIVYNRPILVKNKLIFRNEFIREKYLTTDDIDMGMQLQRLGGVAIYQEKAIVYHKDPIDLFAYLKKIITDAISYTFYLKRWERERKKIDRSVLFTKDDCQSYIIDVYKIPLYKRIALSLLITLTDRILFCVPLLTRLYV